MKTPKRFSRGITGLFLLLILALAGCQDPLSDYADYTVTETGPSLPGPANLQAVKYTGGVLLTWELVPDAAGYQVYRYNQATGEEKALRETNSAIHYYLDLVDFNNPLTPTITYTYKVVAVSGGSGNQRAAIDVLVFNGTSSIDVTFEPEYLPARDADTSGWIKLDDPKVEPVRNDEDLRRVVLENTTPNLTYDAKYVVNDTTGEAEDGSVFVYLHDSEETVDKEDVDVSLSAAANPFNPTKTLEVPVFAGTNTLEVTAAYLKGDYYPGTAVKSVEITKEGEILSIPSTGFSFNAVSSGTDPAYARFTWNNIYQITGYSIYKVKGYRDGGSSPYNYYIQGDWEKVTLKDKALNTVTSGDSEISQWSAAEAAASEPGAYIYALVAEDGTKKSLPVFKALTLNETGLSTPTGFSVTSTPAPYGLDDQYVLITWYNDPHVETYTVYKAVVDPYTSKMGAWTEVTLSDKKLNDEKATSSAPSGVWTAVEKGLPKIDAKYRYKLVATAGDRRVEATASSDLTTVNPANSALSVQSLIASNEPLRVRLTLGQLDPEVTYKLSRAEAAWAEGETGFIIEKAVSVGAFNTPIEIRLPAYHTGDTYTFYDADVFPAADALKERTSYIYKLVKEKSATETSGPVYAFLKDGAYSKASYLRIKRNTNYDGVAFNIQDYGTYWGDTPALKIYRAPKNGEYAELTLNPAPAFASYNDTYLFVDDRTQLVNGEEYHYKFQVTLNGEVLEEREFQYNDLDGDGNDDGRTQKGSSTLYTPFDTPVTAYFAEGSSLSNASVTGFERTGALANLVIKVSGNYVIGALVTVTYTPSGGTADDAKTAISTVSVDRTIAFTGGDIDPNVSSYTITVKRTTGTTYNFSSSVNVPKLKINNFSASAGTAHNSVTLSVIPNNTSAGVTNIPWAGTETVTSIKRKPSSAPDTDYTEVSLFTNLVFWPSPSVSLTTSRTGLDNASNGLATNSYYVYQINITGGYFGTKVFSQETSSVSPRTGSLGSLASATVAGGKVELDFNSGSYYSSSIITVQYKLNTVSDWDGAGVTTVQLTLDNDGKASFDAPADAGTYNIRYKYKNDTSYTTTSTTFIVP
jgi:hypothetical protein